jgi:hypothetical protein
MLDPGLFNNFGWGAVGLAALWMVLTKKPWRNGPPKEQRETQNGASGNQSVSFWKLEIQSSVKSAIAEEFKIRGAMLSENDLRRIIKEVAGEWFDARAAQQRKD